MLLILIILGLILLCCSKPDLEFCLLDFDFCSAVSIFVVAEFMDHFLLRTMELHSALQ